MDFYASLSCPFTGNPRYENSLNSAEGYEYKLRVNEHEYLISLEGDFVSKSETFLAKYRHILKGFLYNGIWLKEVKFAKQKDLEKLIAENTYPKTPQEKIDTLFEYLYKLQDYEGAGIQIEGTKLNATDGIWNCFYFKNYLEYKFYLKQLETLGLAQVYIDSMLEPLSVTLTLEGLHYANKILEGKMSKKCFVAMSFDPALSDVFKQGILPAIEESDYEPILISEVQLNSDETINDGILANIKKSHFIIADFTQNKHGVYFEAGYALGRGLKVIYTCKNEKEQVNGLHFDTNHYQHILWDTIDDLRQKLKDKIEVFIKP